MRVGVTFFSMAKDPAFLFYSSDFLSGVQDLTMDERGQYITLLCLQHQKGHLSEKTIRLSLGNAAADVLAKFRQDADGNFFNERLESEIGKRAAFSTKQKERATKGWEKRKTDAAASNTAYAAAMPLEDENVNENKIVDKAESKNEKKPRQPQIEFELIYPYESQAFMLKWNVLRNEKKWKKKSHAALQAALQTMSEHSESDAIQMMQNAIAGEYQGIFPLNNKSNARDSKQQELDSFTMAAEERLRETFGR